MAKYKLCFVTTDNPEIAHKIARTLVEVRLAACVNIIPNLTSFYRWDDMVKKTQEVMLIIKTKNVLVKDIIAAVKKIHNYSTPEIVFADITDGDPAYFDWIGANTLFTSNITKDREENKQ
ncbi:MAG: divalent-cation tolerance protein CutA [Elusimicrobiales bacterium]|nr:divalent-cation tolerance protein CutA [Elusimicrobiales bacterium]